MDVQIESLKRLTKIANNCIEVYAPALSGEKEIGFDNYYQSCLYQDYTLTYFGQDNVATQLTNFKQTLLPIKEAHNYQSLKKSFEKEQIKTEISKDKINSLFQRLAFSLAELPFEKSSVEITSSKSIKFSMAFTDDILLIISKPFENLEDVSEDEVIFSVFKNRKMITSNVSKPTEVVEGFKRFLSI